MESRTLRLLEFPLLLEHLSTRAQSEGGQAACRALTPLADTQALTTQHALVAEGIEWSGQWLGAVQPFPDIEGVFEYLHQEDQFLDTDGFWGVAQVVERAVAVAQAVASIRSDQATALAAWREQCPWPEKLVAALKRCLGYDGRLTDESSPGLLAVRVELRRIQQQCTRKVQDALQDDALMAYLQDEYFTVSSDRYVLALKANFKGKIPGIVHDYSQSGDTCYLEPFFLVDLNNSLQEFKQQEREEEREVLRYLTGLMRQEGGQIQALYSWLVQSDVLAAKVRLALDMEAVPVRPASGAGLRLHRARHPLLALGAEPVQPVDIALEKGQRALVISGGNAGGKTVCLKTLGLVAVMAHAGLPVPVAADSTVPFWEQVFAFLGDEQSLEDHLSTFTAQIGHFQHTWPHMGPSSLVILDEFGAGTDPSQGAALAQAVLDALLETGAWIGAATHFPALKAYAMGTEGVRAASVLFDPDSRRPLFRLAYDQVGASQALDVARDQGLPQEILARAKEYLLVESNETDRLLERLNRLAAQRQNALDELEDQKERLQQERRRVQDRFERESRALVQEIKTASQEVVRQWKAGKKSRKKTQEELARMRQRLDSTREAHTAEPEPLRLETIQPGQQLTYLPWAKTGVVEEVDAKKDRLKLDLGGISLWAGLEEGQQQAKASGKTPVSSQTTKMPPQTDALPLRLDLRGLRAEEARAEVERFVDRARLEGRHALEVVHGKGEGVLRREVHEILRHMPGVAHFALGRPEQGGDGVTVVELGD